MLGVRPLSRERDCRRKEYQITQTGRRVVLEELQRLQELLENGRKVVRGEYL